MAEENKEVQEVQLTEAELSNVKNSLATLCKKYIAGSFFDKLVDTSGISQAKEILIGDLKNLIGRGTSATAARVFANAIMSARNVKAVDTILANYMLAGDGMRSGIGYTESTEVDHIEAFRKFLSESRKNEMKNDTKGDDKKDDKPSKEQIEEAMKIVEEYGYTAVKIDEKKGCCDGKCDDKDEKKDNKDNKDDDDEKKLKEALAIIEACGKKAKRVIKESEVYSFTLSCGGICDPDGLKDLIDDALATGNIDREVADAIQDIYTSEDSVKIVGDPDVIEDPDTCFRVRDGIRRFLENAPGIEAEVGEDVIDHWQEVFERA